MTLPTHSPAAENGASGPAGALPGNSDGDHRVTCNTCAHYERRNWRCGNARQAMLQRRIGVQWCDIGPELAGLPQDCQGYKAKESK